MSSEHDLNMRRGGLDYDMYVISPDNEDTTFGQLRECIHDALQRIDERIDTIEGWIKNSRGGKE